MSQSRMLELAHERLYWPEPNQIWEPSGSGAQVYAQLAREKIGEKIQREFPEDARGVEVSVLAANPEGNETEAPIAIVCQFSRPVSLAVIRETHRLAWSFSRTRSLITIEPQLLRVWSCCEPPQEQDD
ncbi:MAG: SAM-dependent DNA methyltransferase, partial [Symploca sp. SIO3E6]|nr:SAM-dependent DNA methyltransferase [Caldora sp. SIO3E6]